MLNAGINGNRLLHDGDGESALRRLDRDVLAKANVKYLIVLEGINDIGHIVTASSSDPAMTTQDVSALWNRLLYAPIRTALR